MLSYKCTIFQDILVQETANSAAKEEVVDVVGHHTHLTSQMPQKPDVVKRVKKVNNVLPGKSTIQISLSEIALFFIACHINIMYHKLDKKNLYWCNLVINKW